MTLPLSRRQFLRTTGAAGLGAALVGLPRCGRAVGAGTVRVLSIGVVGTIGEWDRKQVADHPRAEIVGLCDVDAAYLAQAAADHPDAFTCRDYREAFARYADRFDAVIVATPDHTHAPIMLTALAHDKHVYGQKPLVHQLEEITLIERAMRAKPGLVTQVGNQRMVNPGRRAAVEILRSGALGRAVEAHIWTGGPDDSIYFNYGRVLSDPLPPPPGLDWDLWLGPCEPRPYRDLLVPAKWRSWWDFGTGGIGDWGVHLLDVVFFAYDELTSPVSVVAHTPEPAGTFHTFPTRTTTTYAVDSDRFAGSTFPIHYNDVAQAPPRESLGLPAGGWMGTNMTVVVCEGGVMVLAPEGELEIWREGRMTPGLEMPGLPDFPELNHWHAWVDTILGVETELRTPFVDGARITEAALLAVKATRFPGQELRWDKASLSFTNHPEATAGIVRRDYREGFEPPVVG
jgi:predicted dehydrogenase